MDKVYKNILVLVAGFSILHLVFGGKAFLIIALTVLLLSAASEKLAVLIEKGWLWAGGTLGKINAAILLFIIYHILLIPIALISRIEGKDTMHLKAPEHSNFNFNQFVYKAEDLKNPW